MRKLKQIREEKGYTLKDLEELSGVNVSTINKFELGKRQTQKRLLSKIAEALNSTVEEISEVIEKGNEKGFKCLNENCLFNKNKRCTNDVVIEGRGECYGRYKVQAKSKRPPLY